MQTEISHLDTVPKLAGSFVSTEAPAEKRQLGNQSDKKSSRRKSTPERRKVQEETMVDVGRTTNELYRDMHIQAELCLLVSTKARTSGNTTTLEPMLYNKDLNKEIPPVAIDDVDVALPYDVWEGLEIANPQAPQHSELYSKLTMYFQVDATENVNVEEIAREMSGLRDSGVRVDIGRYAAYKDFMEGRKKTEADVIESWHNFERKRRLKERTRARNATIFAMKKKVERFQKLDRQEEADQLSDEVRKLESEVENSDRVDADLAIVHSEELLKYTSSRVGTFNQGHPPAVDTSPMFRGIQTDQLGQVYREHLRKNLYKFGLNADFWYETKEHPYPAKGVVCFKYNAMMLQDRKLGTPVNTPGWFLARCNISHEIVDRNSNTGRPLTHTHDNTAWKHCPNLAKYIRACRYRMEVVRLWYKLFTNQAPEIIAQMMEQSGIVDQADETISAIKERIGGRRKAVLAVVEFGDKGALRLPTILPSYKATMPDPESEEVVYEIVDRAKFELELKSDDPYGPEVQERGNYTWPIQKIDNTNTWFRFSENIQGRNVFTLKLLEALFKDDIAATWDWEPGAIPENVKSLFLTQHQTTDEFDEASAYEEMELVFDSIIEAIPLWAQAYLSTELVDDSVLDWEQDQDWKKLVDPGFQEIEHLKKTVVASKEKVIQYQRAIGAAESAKSDTATVEELVEQRKKYELQYWKHLAKLNTLVRDDVFASFTWNGYAVDNESKRAYADAEQDAGATSSWAKTQLFRCCYEVDTRPVEQDGNARPPPGHQAVTYFIGSERKQDTRQIQIGIRGFDRKVLVPGEPAVDLWYASWYIEKVLKRGVGNVGQLVTMQNMFKFLNSENPQYVQVQGQWAGIVMDINKSNVDGSMKYKVNVLSYVFDDVYDTDLVGGKIDKDRHPIVEVSTEHIWPLQWSFQLRYGDIVAPRLFEYNKGKKVVDEQGDSTMPKATQDGLQNLRFVVTCRFWSDSPPSSIQIIPLVEEYDIMKKNGGVYRNTNSTIFHAPGELPIGKMRRQTEGNLLPTTLLTLNKRIDAERKKGAYYRFTPFERVSKQFGTSTVYDGVAYYNMDDFEEGPEDDSVVAPKTRTTDLAVLSAEERNRFFGGPSGPP